MTDPRIMEARAAMRAASSRRSRAETTVAILRDRKRHVEDAIDEWRKDHDGQEPRLQNPDVFDEHGQFVRSTDLSYPPPPTDEEIEEAEERLADAQEAERIAQQVLEDAVAAAEHDPHDPVAAAQQADTPWVCGQDRLVLFGEEYFRGDPIPDDAMRKLPPKRRRMLVEQHRVREVADLQAQRR